MEPTILSTERLVLRPWQSNDIEGPLGWGRDERFGRYLALPSPYEREDARALVDSRIASDWATEPGFAICRGGRVIGDIHATVDTFHGRAEIGYGLTPDEWGHGYMTEAARAVVGWLFEAYELTKVIARADAGNDGSWRVMEKLGMRREAIFRSHRVLRGERRDEVVYGVLREEWFA